MDETDAVRKTLKIKTKKRGVLCRQVVGRCRELFFEPFALADCEHDFLYHVVWHQLESGKLGVPHRTTFSRGPDITGKTEELGNGCLADNRDGVSFALHIETPDHAVPGFEKLQHPSGPLGP